MTASPVFDGLLGRRLVVVGGSGGVGKTTVSAAIAAALAARGRRVLVVTVDPARRLGQALGVTDSSGNDVVAAPQVANLWVTMLDTKAGWDELVRRHARDGVTAERIIGNPLYDNITSRFVNSHDYIAMERLHELSADPRFDAVVVDTPPSRNALDLLDAPQRMREFFSGRLLRWLTIPHRNRVLGLASRPFMALADRVLGARFLADIAEFFALLATMEKGFVARAAAVEALLASDDTVFAAVTTGESAPALEAAMLVAEVRRRAMKPWAVVVNRLSPVVDAASIVVPSPAEIAAWPGIEATAAARLYTAMRAAVDTAATVEARNDAVLEVLADLSVPLVRVRDTALRDPLEGIVGQLSRQ